jgi:hypothetical protein
MTVIDQILNEWAFRCHDGIVDMNNPEKVKILNEILEKYNLVEQEEEQSIDDKINAIISSLKDDEKEKIYQVIVKAKSKVIDKKEDEVIKSIKDKLIEKKQIPDNIAEYIVLKAEKQDQIDDLDKLVDFISLKNLKEKTDQNLETEAGKLAWINNIVSTQGSLSIGKGELLLAIMIINAKLVNKEGVDLEVTGKDIEIKQSSETGGAIISKSGRSGSYAQMWNNDIFKRFDKKISFKEKWLQGEKRKLSTWTPIFDRFTTLPDEEKVNYVKDINTLLSDPKYGFEGELSTNDFSTLKKLCKKIAYLAVGSYLDEKSLILMNQKLDYMILNDKEQILSNPNIQPNSAFIPRIFYKENPIDESKNITDSLLELSDTNHLQRRLNERGKILDIMNLGEIPLGDYKSSEVKEKLKANIANELRNRVGNILSKDIPSSVSFDIGIKVLKPVLVTDGKKYPLTLYAISTKDIKDKEGNIVDVREVDNYGTLYFLTVTNNAATTLMLLNKENDNDLYFQIKNHEKNAKKEPKILTPSNFIYEIDLDELMGVEKKDQGPALIDPTTLDYTLRTDYRKGATFTHKKFGAGKIINTSSGTGGEGDSSGKLDWVEVDFGKPILKGGKLIPYRRIDNIYTLVSPLLKK